MGVDSDAIIHKITAVNRPSVSETDAPAVAGDDAVELFAGAADFRAALDALAAAPTVREGRVAELRAQLEQGTLQTDGDFLAAKLLKKSRVVSR
jgi:flagellar biosynthesis anti-sigma factor FlgM